MPDLPSGPWYELDSHDDMSEPPEGNYVFVGCNWCGGKWRRDDGWVYNDADPNGKMTLQEQMQLSAMFDAIHAWRPNAPKRTMSRKTYMCAYCLPDHYKEMEFADKKVRLRLEAASSTGAASAAAGPVTTTRAGKAKASGDATAKKTTASPAGKAKSKKTKIKLTKDK